MYLQFLFIYARVLSVICVLFVKTVKYRAYETMLHTMLSTYKRTKMQKKEKIKETCCKTLLIRIAIN